MLITTFLSTSKIGNCSAVKKSNLHLQEVENALDALLGNARRQLAREVRQLQQLRVPVPQRLRHLHGQESIRIIIVLYNKKVD